MLDHGDGFVGVFGEGGGVDTVDTYIWHIENQARPFIGAVPREVGAMALGTADGEVAGVGVDVEGVWAPVVPGGVDGEVLGEGEVEEVGAGVFEEEGVVDLVGDVAAEALVVGFDLGPEFGLGVGVGGEEVEEED